MVNVMLLSKDVFSHGPRAGVHLSGQSGPLSHRLGSLVSVARSGQAAQICVLLGALAAPVLSVMGWIGLVLPESTSLHHAAAGLLASAMIGLGAALIGAHSAKDTVTDTPKGTSPTA